MRCVSCTARTGYASAQVRNVLGETQVLRRAVLRLRCGMSTSSTRFLPLILTALLLHATCHGQIPTQVFERVLHLRVLPKDSAGTIVTGSGFTITVDGRQYLITAKHLVANVQDKAKVGIEQGRSWIDLDMTVMRCPDPADIAVLIPPIQITVGLDLPTSGSRYAFGSEMFFLGFPYDLGGAPVNGGYPFPDVKRATLGLTYPIAPIHHGLLLYLDGYNNPGFSGGPVVFRDDVDRTRFQVVGVISGFRPQLGAVMEPHPIASPEKASKRAQLESWRIVQKPDKQWVEYLDGPNTVALNTGLTIAYSIEPALDLIRDNPVGPKEHPMDTPPLLKQLP